MSIPTSDNHNMLDTVMSAIIIVHCSPLQCTFPSMQLGI